MLPVECVCWQQLECSVAYTAKTLFLLQFSIAQVLLIYLTMISFCSFCRKMRIFSDAKHCVYVLYIIYLCIQSVVVQCIISSLCLWCCLCMSACEFIIEFCPSQMLCCQHSSNSTFCWFVQLLEVMYLYICPDQFAFIQVSFQQIPKRLESICH